jgi:hypothetical protein
MSESISPAAVRQRLQEVGLELALAEMHPDRAATAVAACLVAVERAADGGPAELRAAVDLARGWAAGTSSADDRGRFAAWLGWMEQAVTAWERGRPLPPWPAELPPPQAAQPMPRAAVWAGAEQAVPLVPAEIDDELMRLFCADSEDFLRDIEQGVLVLEERPDDPETLNTVFRAFHTHCRNAEAGGAPARGP